MEWADINRFMDIHNSTDPLEQIELLQILRRNENDIAKRFEIERAIRETESEIINIY